MRDRTIPIDSCLGLTRGAAVIPVTTDLGTTLARETLSRLHNLDLLAASAPREPESMRRAGAGMRALAVTWRGLLIEHQPAADGRCSACCPWHGPQPLWPCGVWRSAHRSLGRYVTTTVVQPAAQSAPEPPESARCPSPVPATVGVGTGLPQAASDPGTLTPVRHGTVPRELAALPTPVPTEPVW